MSTVLLSQNRLNADKGIIYNNEKILDVRLQTHGWWAANFVVGDVRSYNKTNYYRIGIGEQKSVKEVKKSTDFSASSASFGYKQYAFGKQNYAYMLRGGYGIKRYYTEKASKNGVALAVTYSGGATMAMMLPYYLDVSVSRTDVKNVISVKYSPETAALFLDPYKIRGKSSTFKGLKETKIIPGIHGQVGVHLDWGAFDEFVRAIEVGVQLDVFPKKLPIMVETTQVTNSPYFLNFYVSLQMGKRK